MKQEEKRKKLEDKQARAEAYRVARLEEVKEKPGSPFTSELS